MQIYVAAACIVGFIQLIWIFTPQGESHPSWDVSRIFEAFFLALVAGILWPVTIIMWLTTYEAPATKKARLIREDEQRRQQQRDFELLELQRIQRNEEAAVALKRAIEERATILWTRYYSMFDERHVNEMSGAEFERFIGKLYTRLGYVVSFTRTGADQGVDVILFKNGRKTAVQAKRWNSSVGNAAVQEVIAGKLYYGCSHGIIITTSQFSRSAIALASKDSTIQLVDGRALNLLCQEVLSATVPTFSWEAWKIIEPDAKRFFGADLPALPFLLEGTSAPASAGRHAYDILGLKTL